MTILKASFDLTTSKDGEVYNSLVEKVREYMLNVLCEETATRIHVVGHAHIIGQLLADTRVEQELYPVTYIGTV